MKTSRNLFAAFLASLFLTASAFAGDPTGTWTWSLNTRDGQTRETTLKLELKDGKLAGTISGMGGDIAISEATFVDDAVAFSVVREREGNRMVMKYKGRLEGDTIKGTSERSGRDGQARSTEWVATRKK